jgi:hypothetical protein
LLICARRTPEQCGEPSKKDDPIEFTFGPVRAEPLRVAFISDDARVAILLVPNPIENKNKGCTLQVVRLLPNFELAHFTGSGFAPNTKVEFDAQSYDEKHRLEEITKGDGNLEFAMLPFVSGHNNGTMRVKALATQCSPEIKFDCKRLTNTPVRPAGSVLKCPDDRKNRVVSAQATYTSRSSAVGG